MTKKLLLIDGLNLIRRLYAALTNEQDPKRQVERTQAATIDFVVRLLAQFTPSHAVVVFDSSGKTWRHDYYPEYKFGRVPMDDVLLEALPEFAKLLRFNGVAALRLTGWEADDLIATLAVKAAQREIKSYIISTDKGFTQLLHDAHILQYDCFANTGFDKLWVEQKYGVLVSQLNDYWALVGDTTNRIPGVKGVGPKTAVTLLQQAPTIEAIYQDLGRFNDKQQRLLEGGLEQCLLSRLLVTLKTDVEIGIRLSQFSYAKASL